MSMLVVFLLGMAAGMLVFGFVDLLIDKTYYSSFLARRTSHDRKILIATNKRIKR